MEKKSFIKKTVPIWRFFLAGCGVITIVVMLYGCSVRTSIPPVDSSYPPDKELGESVILQQYSRGPASGLYGKAKDSFAQGKNDQAEMAIERALRVEPGNPAYWYYMGKIKLRQNQHAQAIQFCLKSKSLAGKNEELLRINDILISQAQQRSNI